MDVVDVFSSTHVRCDILEGWLRHRAAMRAIGFVNGFQWLDGSFLERKDPKDLDIVTFVRRPRTAPNAQDLARLVAQNPQVFARALVKAVHHLDAMFVDLNGSPEAIVDNTRYWLGLFSHRRVDYVWKGMLKVGLAGFDDAVASALVADKRAQLPAPAVP